MNESALPLARTPLHALHCELGARMVPFAGYEMPVQYPTGIIKEHVHTRAAAGLFDVSHMGQVRLTGAARAGALESLVPVDVIDLRAGSQRYAFFTNDHGGILDDLMIANYDDHLLLVVNAACKQADIAHLRAHLTGRCEVEELSERALLALQGPKAGTVLARLAPDTASMLFMSVRSVTLAVFPARSVAPVIPARMALKSPCPPTARTNLRGCFSLEPEVAPIGLGARDSLRLEAGLCLYGHDIDTTTTPVEANLTWALSKSRRKDGSRPGGYPGAETILAQLAAGVARNRVGLRPQGRMPVREGTELIDETGRVVGKVTSGGFGPTVGAPVAMGYVSAGNAQPGTQLGAIARGQRVEVSVAATPFTPHRYKRR